MAYKTSVHPFWYTVALSNLAVLLTPAFVLANTIHSIPSQRPHISSSPPSPENDVGLAESAENSQPDLVVLGAFPPLPEHQQVPSLTLASKQSHLNIQLVNETNAPIVYQAIGMTNGRIVSAGSSVNLRGLTVPTTLTFQRQDGGLLRATVGELGSNSQTLQLVLDETADLGDSNVALNVESSGTVFLN